MKTRVTEEQKKSIRELAKNGAKNKEIAQRLGLAPGVVTYYTPKKYKRASPKKNRDKFIESDDKAREIGSKWDYDSLLKKYNRALMILLEHDLIEVDL